jgi:glucose-1-phosphate thymidylyltransferase
MIKKGIILAGGKGTRLSPLTKVLNKQLLPLYDKPLIFYPLSVLMLAEIKNILIITNRGETNLFRKILGNGKNLGIKISYKEQKKPNWLPEAFIIGEKFIGSDDDVALILGDNVFITHKKIKAEPNTIFTFKVKDPSAYGVAELDEDNNLINIVEKPIEYISDNAVVGLYVFTRAAIDLAKTLKPSKRGELEIVDLISKIKEEEGIEVEELDGFWFDCGNHDDLLNCANLIKTIEDRTHTTIGLH